MTSPERKAAVVGATPAGLEAAAADGAPAGRDAPAVDAAHAAVVSACDACLRRTDLVAALGGYLDVEWRRRRAPARVLALPDAALLALAASPAVSARYAGFDAAAARARAARAGLAVVCRCARGYPERLRDLADPPAVLHVLGDAAALRRAEGVAVVGARRASAYGVEVARALGHGLSSAGVPVISGLALGIDSAAHAGAVDGRGATTGAAPPAAAAPGPPLAVLAASAHVPYPARGRLLHSRVAARGAVVSELPPGSQSRRWSFVARNRIIAALSAVTVIVQATERSGSLTTADFAAELGRTVAAVPGQVTHPLSAGVNALIQAGAALVRNTRDVLDLLADATGRSYALPAARPPPPPDLPPALKDLLAAVERGDGTVSALAASPAEARGVLSGLGELEFRGLVRRTASGRFERLP